MMARKYQSHAEISNGSDGERSMNTSTKRGKKKNKREKVFTMGFVSTTLLLAIIVFFVCFTVGVVLGPDLPI